MDFFLNRLKEKASDCPFEDQDIQRCPFLRNITKPTNLSFSPVNVPAPVAGAKGPIFEDGPNFDLAFNLFHGKDGVVPLTNRPNLHGDNIFESESAPKFNPLAGKAASISLSSFGLGGPFGFNFFSDKLKKQRQETESLGKQKNHSQKQNSSGHEAVSNEWLQTGNCPIAKSYRAVSHVLPLVAKALQPPSGMKLRCPPAVVAARAALARTAFVKNLRPQPLPAKVLCIAALGMAANIPLGIWREHTQKFSLSWFIAVHAAVPFIAMLRKSVMMPKAAMALTIGASILGQVIGSRAERIRMKIVSETHISASQKAGNEDSTNYNSDSIESFSKFHCGNQQMMSVKLSSKRVNADSPGAGGNVCF